MVCDYKKLNKKMMKNIELTKIYATGRSVTLPSLVPWGRVPRPPRAPQLDVLLVLFAAVIKARSAFIVVVGGTNITANWVGFVAIF